MLSLDNLLRPVSTVESQPGKAIKQTAETAKTLESYHAQHISKFKEEKTKLEDYKKELEERKAQLAHVEKEFSGPSIITSAYDINILTSRQKIETSIRELKDKITKIENEGNVADYFLRVGDILFSYTDAKDRIATGEKAAERLTMKKGRMPANSVYSYFQTDEEEVKSVVVTEQVCGLKKASHISNDLGFRRDKALEHYMSALNPESVQHESNIASSIAEDFGMCPVCNTEMFLNDTYLDCPDCGFRDFILVDSEKPSYKDPPREISYYAYKKINHLNEWLAQFQAKETTEISQVVLDQIRTELRKERIVDMSKLKPSKLKEIIKKLKLNRCYDHVAHILNRLNGISAPVLSREVEEKLRFMFKEIQFSFVKHCPAKRSNFLSYSFVLYKFCELLELDEYLPCFPLLKSREKLYMQDKIWQKICEDMGWEFIRTV
jgi:Zn finger protein HypA/HybF involved in hydrogenase expression